MEWVVIEGILKRERERERDREKGIERDMRKCGGVER